MDISVANTGCGNRVVINPDNNSTIKISSENEGSGYVKNMWQPDFKTMRFDRRSAIVINGKRWYMLLVASKNIKRPRALMDDFSLDSLFRHLIICYTPNRLPDRQENFRTDEGKPIHLFTCFDSYLDFFEYLQGMPMNERHFYEIICGVFPQKPHFDIDIKKEDLFSKYPDQDLETFSNNLVEQVIRGCQKTFEDMNLTLNIEKDVLIYTSHGDSKRSYHIVINNYCHSDNKEAKAFYEKVVEKITGWGFGGYCSFIDHSVYSARQQFRVVGSQKLDSGRVKMYHEEFGYQGIPYRHIYSEFFDNEMRKELIVLQESLVSFTSNCIQLQNLVPAKAMNTYNFTDRSNLNSEQVTACLKMMHDKIKVCPFSVKEINGHVIILKRQAASLCPVCDRIHDAENPFIYIMDSRVYWDCRRSDSGQKLFLGFLETEEPKTDPNDDASDAPNFQFGIVSFGKDNKVSPPKQNFQQIVSTKLGLPVEKVSPEKQGTLQNKTNSEKHGTLQNKTDSEKQNVIQYKTDPVKELLELQRKIHETQQMKREASSYKVSGNYLTPTSLPCYEPKDFTKIDLSVLEQSTPKDLFGINSTLIKPNLNIKRR